MTRRLVALLAAALLLVLTAGPIAAKGAPTHDFYEPGGLSFAPGEVCSFGVDVEVVRGHAHDQIRESADGSLHIKTTGSLVGRVTNTSTGEWLIRNFSGPLDVFVAPDGTATAWNRGHTIAWLIPAEGGPALWHHRGTILWTVDVNGLFTIVRETGHREDLCALLA